MNCAGAYMYEPKDHENKFLTVKIKILYHFTWFFTSKHKTTFFKSHKSTILCVL